MSNEILSLGTTPLNRLCGPDRMGIQRGEMIGLLGPHNTSLNSFCLELLANIVINNPMTSWENPVRKPLLVVYATEHITSFFYMYLYAFLKRKLTGIGVSIIDEYATKVPGPREWVENCLRDHGWYIEVEEHDPFSTTKEMFFDSIKTHESDGYDVVCCLFENLEALGKQNASLLDASMDLDLLRNVRQFVNDKDIACLAPLGTDIGFEEFIQSKNDGVPTREHHELENQLDLAIYVYQTNDEGNEYSLSDTHRTFHVIRGKHRKVALTPKEDLYFKFREDKARTFFDGPHEAKSDVTV